MLTSYQNKGVTLISEVTCGKVTELVITTSVDALVANCERTWGEGELVKTGDATDNKFVWRLKDGPE